MHVSPAPLFFAAPIRSTGTIANYRASSPRDHTAPYGLHKASLHPASSAIDISTTIVIDAIHAGKRVSNAICRQRAGRLRIGKTNDTHHRGRSTMNRDRCRNQHIRSQRPCKSAGFGQLASPASNKPPSQSPTVNRNMFAATGISRLRAIAIIESADIAVITRGRKRIFFFIELRNMQACFRPYKYRWYMGYHRHSHRVPGPLSLHVAPASIRWTGTSGSSFGSGSGGGGSFIFYLEANQEGRSGAISSLRHDAISFLTEQLSVSSSQVRHTSMHGWAQFQ